MKKALALTLVLACDTTSFSPDVAFREASLDVVTTFNPQALETPESVVFDRHGNAYVSLALTGEIRKIDSDGDQSTYATIPIGFPLQQCFNYIAIMGALTTDEHGSIYANAAACDLDNRGVWKVDNEGDAMRIAALPADALPNGIDYRHGQVYVADSGSGRIWTASVSEVGDAQVWATSPLLDPVPNPFGAPGANGLQVVHDELWVANASAGTIVAIPFVGPGNADAGEAYVLHEFFPGCDDFAVDVHGRIYCTTDPFQTVLRLDPDGTVTTLLTAADGLDGPTDASFGVGADSRTLFISNAAFPFFPSTGNGPSLLALEVDLPGE